MKCDEWNFKTVSFSACRFALSDDLRAIYLKPDFAKVCPPPSPSPLLPSLSFLLSSTLFFLLSPSFPSLLHFLLSSFPLPLSSSISTSSLPPSWHCRSMCATFKHSVLVKRSHVLVRHTRVTCYDFLTQEKESYSGELVTSSEWNTSLVVRVICEFCVSLLPQSSS